jgi:hypothetical protein
LIRPNRRKTCLEKAGDWIGDRLDHVDGFEIGIRGGTDGVGPFARVHYNEQIGNVSIKVGVQSSYYSHFSSTGKSGLEMRYSFMATYHFSKDADISFGTNLWRGYGEMREFNQRTGILGIHSGKFSFYYENDGMPFALGQVWYKAILGNGNDSYRTAAVRIGWGEYGAGFNLFTGFRDDYDGDKEKKGLNWMGRFNERMPNHFVNEGNPKYGNPRYRMGAAYLSYGENKIGIDSDRWIRHPIQDMFAHNMPGTRQPGFETLSNTIKPYFQVKTIKQGIRFSLYE